MRYLFASLVCFFLCQLHIGYSQLAENFKDQLVSEGWIGPAGIAFDAQNRMFVWERRGMVHIVENGERLPQPLLDISEEVSAYRDHGLLGFALHPNFLNNGYFYVLYSVDRHHLMNYGTANYDPDSSIQYQASISRLTRYTADPASNFTTVLPDSRKVLIGETRKTGFPLLYESHDIGSLVFGEDGTLLVSSGDAASYLHPDAGQELPDPTYAQQALEDSIISPAERIGSFRSQSLESLNGKILRIDPLTGNGIPSNPFYDPDRPRAPRSRIWALGFRNPFRINIIPETGAHTAEEGNPGTIIVGDVGSSLWEELNIVDTAGMNMGWPIYEGIHAHWQFAALPTPNRTTPIDTSLYQGCDQQYYNFRDLLWQPKKDLAPTYTHPCDEKIEIPQEIPRFVHTPPALSWSSIYIDQFGAYTPGFDPSGLLTERIIGGSDNAVKGTPFAGGSSLAGVFYTGEAFPEEYHNTYFHVDYALNWIKNFTFDELGMLTSARDFHDAAVDVVHLTMNPEDECIYYVFHSVSNGQIRKICYGGNSPPTAVIDTDQTYGPGPLSVQFSAASSIDPDGDSLFYFWEFGDGSTSTLLNPTHTFHSADDQPQGFEVKLVVKDSLGDSTVSTQIISINNTPPVVEISSISDSSFYGTTGSYDLPLEASVSDAEHSEDEFSYEWQTFLHHNTHFHPEPIDNNPSTSTFITPLGCGDETYWYRFKLTVTDPAGLSSQDEEVLFPDCGPRPAIFQAFDASRESDGIALNWETLSENINEEFEIERALDTRGEFETFATVASSGTVNQPQSYQFLDDNPYRGVNRYRVKALNAYGSFVYTEPRTIVFPEGIFVSLFPNPIVDKFSIRLFPFEKQQIYLTISNLIGQELLAFDWLPEEEEATQIDISALPHGVYIYNVRQGDQLEVGKLIKQ